MKQRLKQAGDRATQTRNAVATRLRAAGAVSRATATTIAFDAGEAKLIDRMIAFGAVKETPEGARWLDERRFVDFRKEGLASVLGYLALAGFAAAGALAATG
ncbi:hypothetical protein ASG29_12905 [Sphingomonas sp. Leaf412]|uniref:hypothetical protein n=1 Tax=Sphingomonas sp. Leaf412 TaxID=1736370 RepID=UPI0006F5B438|nr:hypothetical protein [Sphingomonas sp. Leaf412]KQT32636.1 hypothetical protein ASG29_12905 [Sphingomonas sp. Leaf412]